MLRVGPFFPGLSISAQVIVHLSHSKSLSCLSLSPFPLPVSRSLAFIPPSKVQCCRAMLCL